MLSALRYITYGIVLVLVFYTMDQHVFTEADPRDGHSGISSPDTLSPNAENNMKAAKKLYQRNCAVCHLSKGEGLVGPNLTDEYWIYGGNAEDIEHIIKVGVKEKGMEAMETKLSDLEIKQLTNYVLGMQGTQPEKGKEPEGEIYIPVN